MGPYGPHHRLKRIDLPRHLLIMSAQRLVSAKPSPVSDPVTELRAMRDSLGRVEKIMARQTLQWGIDHLALVNFDSFDSEGRLHESEEELQFVLLSFLQAKAGSKRFHVTSESLIISPRHEPLKGASVMKLKLEFSENDPREVSDDQAKPYFVKLCDAIHTLIGCPVVVDFLEERNVHFIRCPELYKAL